MTVTLAIDPGADQGWALIDSVHGIFDCGLGDWSDAAPARCVIEFPQHRPGGRTPVNALLVLAARAGAAGERARASGVPHCEYVYPVQWKGSVPKDIHHPRIMAALLPCERRVVAEATRRVAKGKRHNVLDACGIALWAVGRGV